MMPCRVALVDDSSICTERLTAVLECEGDIAVVADAHDGREAVSMVRRHAPSVLVTDLVMPGVDGLEVVEAVMADSPVPILVVTGNRGADSNAAFESIRRGALEFVEKPPLGDRAAESALRQAVRRAAKVLVVRHPRVVRPVREPSSERLPRRSGPGEAKADSSRRVVALPASNATTLAAVNLPRGSWMGPRPLVIGIGSSAGGPPALAALLGALPKAFPACIAVAQHLPKGYADGFAQFLSARCKLQVAVCRETMPAQGGLVLVAPDGQDLVAVDGYHIGPRPASSEAFLVPSADLLLGSLAVQLGRQAVGVVLSGIGDDGVLGMAALRARGALTLVQDEASCAVYGMPKAASSHALCEVCPEGIAKLLVELLRGVDSRK